MTTIFSDTANLDHIKTCGRCGVRYDWRKSPSGYLKMTYCGTLCEIADLGFSIETLLGVQRAGSTDSDLESEPEAAGELLAA